MAVMLGGSGTLGVGVVTSGAGRGRLADGDGRESADLRPESESAWRRHGEVSEQVRAGQVRVVRSDSWVTYSW